MFQKHSYSMRKLLLAEKHLEKKPFSPEDVKIILEEDEFICGCGACDELSCMPEEFVWHPKRKF